MVSYPELQNFSSYNEHPDYEERQNEESENGEKEKKEEKEPEKLRHICDPMCLLYAKNGHLIPLAIQLTQNPSVYTPMYTRCVQVETI